MEFPSTSTPEKLTKEKKYKKKQLYDYLASSTPAPHAPREALAAFALEASKLGLSVAQAAAAANLVPTREVDAFAIAPSLDEQQSSVEEEGSDKATNGALPLIEACKALKAASDSAAAERARKRAEEEAAADEDEAVARAAAAAAAVEEEDE